MEREYQQLIRQKIADALAAAVPSHTRRDVHLPRIQGKALAVIGMRRSGKTTFLWQCLGDRLHAGTPRSALLYFNFEDERLAEMTAHELHWVVEEYSTPSKPSSCSNWNGAVVKPATFAPTMATRWTFSRALPQATPP